MVEYGLDNAGTQPCHSLGQPGRDPTVMQGKIGKSGTFHTLIIPTDILQTYRNLHNQKVIRCSMKRGSSSLIGNESSRLISGEKQIHLIDYKSHFSAFSASLR